MPARIQIHRIVRLRRMLLLWRKRVALNYRRLPPQPPDVPAGHVAVQVGCTCRRFVFPATYLNHQIFRKLLLQAEEEYGFTNSGPLAIPCDEAIFEEILYEMAQSN